MSEQSPAGGWLPGPGTEERRALATTLRRHLQESDDDLLHVAARHGLQPATVRLLLDELAAQLPRRRTRGRWRAP